MADVMQGLVCEAKKNKYSAIGHSLNEEDVISVWDNVSAFIEKQMAAQKGVKIEGLGTFTFSTKKLDVGNNKFILAQRPVFQISEKFAETHNLDFPRHHTSVPVPVVQLNYSALSFESPFDRDSVESCVRDVLAAMSRSVAAKKNVEFTFSGIGRLQIRNGKVKMKFYKDFLNSMDGTGKLVDALKDRPGTVDSVISNRSPSRAFTSNTLVLPRISQDKLALGVEDKGVMPSIREEAGQGEEPGPDVFPEGEQTDNVNSPTPGGPLDHAIEFHISGNGHVAIEDSPLLEQQGDDADITMTIDKDGLPAIASASPRNEAKRVAYMIPKHGGGRSGSRTSMVMAQATGISLMDDLIPHAPPSGGNRPYRSASQLSKSSPAPLAAGRAGLSPLNLPNSAQTPRLTPLSDMFDTGRSRSADKLDREGAAGLMPATTSPHIRFASALLKPSAPKDREATPSELTCGHKNAGQELCYLCHQREQRNVPVSFSEERGRREQEDDRLLQQFQHLKDSEAILGEQEQLLKKRHENQKMAAFNLGVSEAIKSKSTARPIDFHPSYIFQKRPLTPPKFIKQEQYFGDLSGQVVSKEDVANKHRADDEFLERLEQVQLAEDLAAQREQYLKDKAEQQEQYKRALSAQVRFKSLPLPARVPDSCEPVFGKDDMTNEKMLDRRREAHSLYKQQLATVEQRKRDTILKQLTEQQDEEEMLTRTKKELLDDRSNRFERLYKNRKMLEGDWAHAHDIKKGKDAEQRLHAHSPGQLVHEQCDRYKRCGQCKRRKQNGGESNIWRETYYIPGSRLMV